MQAIYAWYCTGEEPATTFEINLKEFTEGIREHERRKGDKGDSTLLMKLFYDTIEKRDEFDQLIQSKAENWELERIALLDRILMQMGICEILHFPEIPIKVSINEYLEIAKKFSTPKSSKFINGILDSLYIEFKKQDKIQKSGRGLINESLPKKGRPGQGPGYGGEGRGRSPQYRSGPEKPKKKKRPRIRKKEAGNEQPPAPEVKPVDDAEVPNTIETPTEVDATPPPTGEDQPKSE